MADISFNEEPAVLPVAAARQGGMAAWMVRSKFAKDEKEATVILVSIVVVALIAAGLLAIFSGGSAAIDANERLRLEASTPVLQ